MKLPASEFQKVLAKLMGISIDESSFLVSVAQITYSVAPALWLKADQDASSPKQIDYAAALGIDVSEDPKRVASAKIQEQLDKRNESLVREMGLAPGDKVYWGRLEREMVISSIAKNSRLWFKGGNGYGAFPHEVDLIAAEKGPGSSRLYGFSDVDLDKARSLVESALGVDFYPHDSIYRGGNYYLVKEDGAELILQLNFDCVDNDLAETEFSSASVLLYLDGKERAGQIAELIDARIPRAVLLRHADY